MKIRVLGSAAGGGFPQWNCNCENCTEARSVGSTARTVTPRTQSSIIVGDGASSAWVLINASPDILSQIRATPCLQPARARRDSGIAAVLLMDAQIDHVTGLLMLREASKPLPIYATAPVFSDLRGSLPLLNVLSHYCGTEAHILAADGSSFAIPALEGVSFSAVPLTSKAPPYSPHRNDPQLGDNIGLTIKDDLSGRTAFYAPGLGRMEPAVEAAMRAADVLLLDGTFWTEDEMINLGLSSKPASEMGHIPQSGPGNMIEILNEYSTKRRVLIHINNSNPVLCAGSPEFATL